MRSCGTNISALNDVSYIDQYPTISPFGINGGYYYTKLNVTF
jgi:hypothetical protein